MKFRINKKYIYWGITAFLVLAAAILFNYGVSRLSVLGEFLLTLLTVLTPIIYGFVIAYLLCPAVNFIEKKIFYRILHHFHVEIEKSRRLKSLFRMLSIFLTIALTLFVLYQLLYMLIPELVNSISNMISSTPLYWNKSKVWIEKLFKDQPVIEEAFLTYSDSLLNYLTKDLLPQVNEILMNFSVGIWDFMIGVKNIAIGAIVSIYILNSKETFAAGSKKLLYSIFNCRRANLFLHNLRFVHTKFGGFIIGKIIDSFIIGVICFIVISIMDMPYAALISVIIGVTNVIPFFGPYIGAIPCAFLILIVNPIQCIYFIIFILILQTFDGNVLGPKILSESTDLTSFWIIFSILVGGGLFGLVGMFIGVPMFAVIYAVINSIIDRSLTNKQLSTDTEKYINLKSIDPIQPEQKSSGDNTSAYEFTYLEEESDEFKTLKMSHNSQHKLHIPDSVKKWMENHTKNDRDNTKNN